MRWEIITHAFPKSRGTTYIILAAWIIYKYGGCGVKQKLRKGGKKCKEQSLYAPICTQWLNLKLKKQNISGLVITN